MRTLRRFTGSIVALALSACGGGGDSPSGPNGQNPLPPARVSVSADTTSVERGQSVTITWSTEANTCVAGNGWSGSKTGNGAIAIGPMTQTTVFSLSCAATATTAATQASVTVNVSPANLPPPTASKVVADSALTSLDYLRVNAKAADLVWDSHHSRLLAVTRANSPLEPSSLLAIDPTTGTRQTVALTDEPSAVAISGDGEYVYVGFAHNGAIHRFLAANLTPDISFAVSSDPLSYINHIEVSPASAHVIAVIANYLPGDPTSLPGLVIVDDGVARPKMLRGSMPLPSIPSGTSIHVAGAIWSDDASEIFATVATYTRGLLTLAVTPQGVSAVSQRYWPLVTAARFHGDRVFSDIGQVFSLSGPVELLGRIPDSGHSWPFRVESEARGKAFSVERHLSDGIYEDGTTLNAFDLERLTYIDSITFNGAALFNGGKIITWGNDGLAMAGSDALLIAHGSFASVGGIPPAQPSTAPILANGAVTSASGTLGYRVLSYTARDLVSDSCGHLYAATDQSAWSYPSSIVEVDVETSAVLRAVHIPGEPYHLAVSDDCSTLYAGLDASNSVARVRLSDMTVDAVLPLGIQSDGFMAALRARSISVAPGQPHTVAIAKGDMDVTLCGGSDDGIAIFDDLTKRPVDFGQGQSRSIKALQWGATATILYGEDWDYVYALTVDSTGANSPRALFPYRNDNVLYDLGRDLYFDRNAGRLYNSFGAVYDTVSNTELPPIQLADRTSVSNSSSGRVYNKASANSSGCGTPGVARVSDRVTGKLFFVIYEAPFSLSIAAYDKTKLTLLGLTELGTAAYSPGFAFPLRVVRPKSGVLAVVTTAGQVALLQGQLLAP